MIESTAPTTEPHYTEHTQNYLASLRQASHIAEPIPFAQLQPTGIQQTYLMFDSSSGCYKIGKSKNPVFREKTLGAQIPRIKLVATCATDIESKLHEQFDAKRVRGEWFDLNTTDLDRIIKQFEKCT
tara:strand:- start:451 stop:831 length:381 start_codon:yes stop_codon:yes gene_type:complete